MKSRRFGRFLGIVLAGLVALAGCHHDNRPLVPVRGKVTLNGKPLAGGTVSLIPLEAEVKGPQPEGELDTQGDYALKTGGKEGAPIGKYRAVVVRGGADKGAAASFDPVYSDWRKSPLIVEVVETPPAGAYDLHLTPVPP